MFAIVWLYLILVSYEDNDQHVSTRYTVRLYWCERFTNSDNKEREQKVYMSGYFIGNYQ